MLQMHSMNPWDIIGWAIIVAAVVTAILFVAGFIYGAVGDVYRPVVRRR